MDLPGKPEIPARLAFVREAPRCTRLAIDKVSIHMVEHLLSALGAMGIDNARIEVDGPEILAADGSAKLFVELIEKAGVKVQKAPRKVLKITRPVYWSEGDVHLVALPDTRISNQLHLALPAIAAFRFTVLLFFLKL